MSTTGKIQNIFIKFSYDGANYTGAAQASPDDKSITAQIVHALTKLKMFYEYPVFSGRTDKGVSASNMVVSIKVKNFYDNMNFAMMLDKKLPKDIVIKGWLCVDDEFSARFNCVQRHYKYFFDKMYIVKRILATKRNTNKNLYKLADSYLNSIFSKEKDPICNVQFHNYVLEVIKRMNVAVGYIRQLKSFENFCNKGEERNKTKMGLEISKDFYMRKLDYMKLIPIEDAFYLDIRGKAFLYNMVRKIFFCVFEYGIENIKEQELQDILNNKKKFGISEPENLQFCCCKYPMDINWNTFNSQKTIEYLSFLNLKKVLNQNQNH